jgi:hypothetical protein
MPSDLEGAGKAAHDREADRPHRQMNEVVADDKRLPFNGKHFN